MSDMKLSVCITFYNQRECVERAVESVLSQDIPFQYEILIGDDGSNDGTYELLCDKYERVNNIRIFRQERGVEKTYSNWRHSALIVRLMHELKGEYFAILDGDDYYIGKDGFKKKVEILDASENYDCVMCVSNFSYCYDDGTNEIAIKAPLARKKNHEETFLNKPDDYLPVATGLIRSNIIQYLDERYTREFADYNIYFWAMQYGKRYYLDCVTFCYRINGMGIFTGAGDVLRAFRTILCIDSENLQYSGKYRKKRMKLCRKSYQIVFCKRGHLSDSIDRELWLPYAKELHGWGEKLLDYECMSLIQKECVDLQYFSQIYLPMVGEMLFRKIRKYIKVIIGKQKLHG